MISRNPLLCVILSIALLLVSSKSLAYGLSVDRQKAILDSLRNYESTEIFRAKRSKKEIDEEAKYCEAYSYKRGQSCFESKYIKNGYYVVEIAFEKNDAIPVQPSAPYIPGTENSYDTAARDAFFAEFSDSIFREYLGDDYRRFNSIQLKSVNRSAVSIELLISEAEELASILSDPRIIHVHHVGSPSPELEEITN